MTSGFKLVVALFAIYCGVRWGSAYRRTSVEGKSVGITQLLDDNTSLKQELAENQARVVVVDEVIVADAKEGAVAQEVQKYDIALGADQKVGSVPCGIYRSGSFPGSIPRAAPQKRKRKKYRSGSKIPAKEVKSTRSYPNGTIRNFVVDPISETPRHRVTIKEQHTDYKVTIYTETQERYETSVSTSGEEKSFYAKPEKVDDTYTFKKDRRIVVTVNGVYGTLLINTRQGREEHYLLNEVEISKAAQHGVG